MNVRYQNLHVFRYCASRVAANTAKDIAVNSERTNICSFSAINFIYLCIYYYIVSL